MQHLLRLRRRVPRDTWRPPSGDADYYVGGARRRGDASRWPARSRTAAGPGNATAPMPSTGRTRSGRSRRFERTRSRDNPRPVEALTGRSTDSAVVVRPGLPTPHLGGDNTSGVKFLRSMGTRCTGHAQSSTRRYARGRDVFKRIADQPVKRDRELTGIKSPPS